MSDSFLENNTDDRLYEWITEPLTQMIRSKTNRFGNESPAVLI